tara:strand:+ start:30066 stop:31289 length:1224 start_codon:yes stop_codon:yes gene_type:complete
MHFLRSSLVNRNKSKQLLIVLDGVGGIPNTVKTELDSAKTPNLNKFIKKSETGCHIPIKLGLTPGSGSAHLALFGYDPLEFDIGRGILEALGLDIKITDKDIAIRGNFATIKKQSGKNIISDRRAGRISTNENIRIIRYLSKKIKYIDGYKISFVSGIEHRFVCKVTCPKKITQEECRISDTDPQSEGLEPLLPKNLNKKSSKISKILINLINKIRTTLLHEKKANFVLFRGFSTYPKIPSFSELYKIKSASITTYPMYKGIGKLVGMEPLKLDKNDLKSQVKSIKKNINNYDFFYLHIKKTDSYGEDGNFKMKSKIIEEFDQNLPEILKLKFDVIAITGDHSTPSKMKSHSWHPVPVAIHSKNSFIGLSKRFNEVECLKGSMGIFEAKHLLTLMFAHSGILDKFGA